MQRILHITGRMNRAGAETMVMNLYRTIDRSQFQFDFLYFTAEECDFDAEIKELGGEIHRIIASNPIRRMLATKKLLQENTQWKIVHCHTLFSNAFHVRAAKMAKVPFRIAHSHNTSDQSNSGLIATIYQNFSRRKMNKYSTHFIGCGKEASEFLFPKQKDVFFLPNSIDTVYFATVGEKEKDYLNKEFNIDDTYLKIIQIGRLQKVKNHLFSIKIAEKLKEKNIRFKMFFIGQGELEKEIKKEIREKHLTDEVLLTGLRTDISQLMAGADVMLMPSLHEGFPVVLVEAQSVGIPSLVSSDVSAEVDLGVDLVTFESLDASLGNWVEKLSSLKHRKRIEKNERLNKLAEQGFDIYSSVQILSELYKSMN